MLELVCVSNRVAREGLADKVTFEQRPEGAEGVCPWHRCGKRQWGVQDSEAGGCLACGWSSKARELRERE